MKERGQRALRRGNWKYLRVNDREYLYDLDYDWRERTDFADEQPALLAELRAQWESWDADMLPLPEEETMITAHLSRMLW